MLNELKEKDAMDITDKQLYSNVGGFIQISGKGPER